jgi:abortive infection AbiH-like protein
MEQSIINRLIIIGNGFDLKLKLRTSYKHFIYGFVNDVIENIDHYLRELNILFEIKTPRREILRDEDPICIVKDFLEIKSPLLKIALSEIENWNWTDIERVYYSELIKIYDNSLLPKLSGPYDYLSDVRQLNLELVEIKKFLSKYLNDEVKKNGHRFDIDDHYENLSQPFDCKDFDDATLDLKKSEIKDKIPSKVLILNFNYTKLFKDSFTTAYWYGLDQDFTILNIHGTMDDPSSMVFGYGDELDEKYNKLEFLDQDEWLKNFKSFSYFKAKAYDKLLGFIETGDFQTWILGHSCGLSDKTMLNHIFEHDKCINLKAFYHEKNANGKITDNFDEICFSISRIMKDKKKMRQIVTKKHKKCNIKFI